MTSAEKRFMWALQALAQPAGVQLGLFPNFVEVADELALEHEEAQANWRDEGGESGLSSQQAEAIKAVDSLLEQMSGSDKAEILWTVEALESRQEWREVRRRASEALAHMGWPNEAPPVDRGDVFVPKPTQ